MKKYKFTILFALVVLILSVLPGSSFPKVKVTNIDKAVHFLLYFMLVCAMYFDNFLNKNKNLTNKKLLCFFIFAVFFGAIVEVIQYFLPFRSAEWYDLLSNTVGAGFGTGVIFFVSKR